MIDPKARALPQVGFAALLALVFLSDCNCGTKLVSRPPTNEHDDEYSQAGNRLIDVLWVVDNSCSMADKQDDVANSFLNFISYFAHGGIDYRIAVTTCDIYNDRGTLLGDPPIITPPPQTPDPVTAFQRNVHVGTGGNGDDRCFSAMQMALDNQNMVATATLGQQTSCLAACASGDTACSTDCTNKYSPAFMRPDAYLYVVAVTDGDDDSFGEVSYFYRYLSSVKGVGNNNTVTFSAIVGLPPPSPTYDGGVIPPDAGFDAGPDASPMDAGAADAAPAADGGFADASGLDAGAADAAPADAGPADAGGPDASIAPDAGGTTADAGAVCTASVGTRYIELAQLTGGIVGDICAPDFSGNLANLAYNAAGLQRRFALTAVPNLATLTVKVHYRCDASPQDIGQPCQSQTIDCPDGGPPDSLGNTCQIPQNAIDGWTYESATNTIYFNGQSIPGIRSQVEFHYFSVDTAGP